jgi:hypothetical protein
LKNTKGENMNCEFSEKVSAFIDEELSEAESNQIKKHISECADCQNLEKDFLFFRRQIKQSATEEFEQTQAIYGERKSLLKRNISLPAPVFSILILVLLSLSVWFLFSSINKNRQNLSQVNTEENTFPKKVKTANETSLARFDTGGKAEIYIAPR